MITTKIKLLYLGIVAFFMLNSSAQTITQNFSIETFPKETLQNWKQDFGTNKVIPEKYEAQILIALSYYPELKDTQIEFRVKKTKTPLTSKPNILSFLLSAKKRKYCVTISEQSNTYLEPILFKNLSFNAQIGVLGHELAHIANYRQKGFGKMFNIIGIEIFSKKQVDKFEYNTDRVCINHGLGYQLLDWSKWVRQNLGRDNWRGANNITINPKKERYMNPESILKMINELPIYNLKQ
ncbi:hypothetical protein [Flavobacterium sp. UBA7682]|uniref:hypothetical protein n=1 Tax=Flavobacterium sp. UBA7682 TaxID=1946560 RepID=UPI0025B7DA3A|nr:hypothetical protein [Flavobacterium sp. UBA7682]